MLQFVIILHYYLLHWRKVVVSDTETAFSFMYTPARVLRLPLDTREQAANKEELGETYRPFYNHKNNPTQLKAAKTHRKQHENLRF